MVFTYWYRNTHMSAPIASLLYKYTDFGQEIEDEYGSIGGYFVFSGLLIAMMYAIIILVIPFAALGGIFPMFFGVPLLYGLMSLWWLVIGFSARFATTIGAGVAMMFGALAGTGLLGSMAETDSFRETLSIIPPTLQSMWIAGIVATLSYIYIRYRHD